MTSCNLASSFLGKISHFFHEHQFDYIVVVQMGVPGPQPKNPQTSDFTSSIVTRLSWNKVDLRCTEKIHTNKLVFSSYLPKIGKIEGKLIE